MKKLFLVLVILVLQAAISVAGVAAYWWNIPADGAIREMEYEVKEGATLHQVSRDLEALGVLRWPLFLRIHARLEGQGKSIKAGPYVFPPGILPSGILEKLTKGLVRTVQFGIPEGWNMYQVAERLAQVFPHVSKNNWLKAMRDPAFLQTLPEPAATLEGYLFPETYTIRPKATPTEVIRMMVNTFHANFTPEMREAGEKLGLSPHRVVTMASIIEKETSVGDERPRISAVFHNRLRKGMRIQADPTVIYGIWERYDGNIRKKDLLFATPYNTYARGGLPVGPIANPGKASLLAAVNPAPVQDLYFVGKGDGSHLFSATLKEHERAVLEYQIKPARKQRAKNAP